MVYFVEFDLLQDERYFLIHDSLLPASQNSINILLSLFNQKYDLKVEYVQKESPFALAVIEFNKKTSKTTISKKEEKQKNK